MKQQKTYKREVSILLLVFLCYLAFIGSVEVLQVLIWPFMLFIGASFGMDWASKQGESIVGKIK